MWVRKTSVEEGHQVDDVPWETPRVRGPRRCRGLKGVAGLLCGLLAWGCGGGGGPWELVELPTDAEFRDVYFSDPRHGFLVGGGFQINGGIIGRTEDGGRTWRFRSGLVRPSPRSHHFLLNAIEFAGPRLGVIVGSGGVILRSVDGGANWHVVGRSARASAHLQDVSFVDVLNGWVVGGGGVRRTTDGGETWRWAIRGDADHGYFSGFAIHFFDLQHGLVAGDSGRIHRTTDGGTTWEPVTDREVGGRFRLRALHFQEERGWAVGEGGLVLHTVDAGRSWIRQDSGTDLTLFDVHFVDPAHGWAIGSDPALGGSLVLRTSNGGEAWEVEQRVDGEALHALFFSGPGRGWAVGDRVRDRPQQLLIYRPDGRG
jgi:photosystem II stability/assembly factor-like uncharacterized protein